MASFSSPREALLRLWRSTEGTATVEAAVIFAFLFLPLLLGLGDFMTLYRSQFLVDEAAQDVVTYVLNAGASATASGITSAAQASNGSVVATINPSAQCYCVRTDTTAPTMPASIACTGTCPGNAALQKFEKITLGESVTLPFPMPALNLASPYTVSASVLIRSG